MDDLLVKGFATVSMIIIDENPLNLNCRRRTAPVWALWHTAPGLRRARVDTTRK
jgi:hypothetical protein